ncbi:hypothetical protein F8M41_022427 [Gigaspora margarita]|uniref:F-box domain-containing protein n=1 Tax=Gigaspora margarita TaxID=4874 RepID=A0A8H4AF20_GIGMA|nr:hypothetical protein F8M41_022427 [Gigaspora margarita]
MNTLPNECYDMIFNNFQYEYNDLFSCALVNRQWCRIIIPILWRDPYFKLEDIRFIRTLLLTLNVEEQTLLIPFNITLPSYSKPLFEYTCYITSINSDLYKGIRNWLSFDGAKNLLHAIKSSLIVMFLRTSGTLKDLRLDEIICNQLLFEKLYENTTVTHVSLFISYKVNDDLLSKSIDRLVKFVNKNSTLTCFNLTSIRLGIKGVKTLLEALYKNTVLNSLGFFGNRIVDAILDQKEEKQ